MPVRGMTNPLEVIELFRRHLDHLPTRAGHETSARCRRAPATGQCDERTRQAGCQWLHVASVTVKAIYMEVLDGVRHNRVHDARTAR